MAYEISGTTVIANDRTVTAVEFVGLGALPFGSIILWYGATNTIPSGWSLCNGNNGTPDLRNKFVVGAANNPGTYYEVGDTGGSDTVSLTANQGPSHSHTGNSGNQNANHTHGGNTGNQSANHSHSGNTGNQNRNHTHTGITGNDTPDHAHNVGNFPNSNVERGNRNSRAARNDRSTRGTTGATARHRHGFTTSGISVDHQHSFNTGNQNANHSHSFNTGNQSANHSHSISLDPGGGSGAAHENRPPYHALCFIMRTG